MTPSSSPRSIRSSMNATAPRRWRWRWCSAGSASGSSSAPEQETAASPAGAFRPRAVNLFELEPGRGATSSVTGCSELARSRAVQPEPVTRMGASSEAIRHLCRDSGSARSRWSGRSGDRGRRLGQRADEVRDDDPLPRWATQFVRVQPRRRPQDVVGACECNSSRDRTIACDPCRPQPSSPSTTCLPPLSRKPPRLLTSLRPRPGSRTGQQCRCVRPVHRGELTNPGNERAILQQAQPAAQSLLARAVLCLVARCTPRPSRAVDERVT
jgi:hypothetical protein